MATLSYTLTVQIANGPRLASAGSLNVTAYDKIEVTVPGAAGGADGTVTVAVQPSNSDRIELLMITASRYSSDSLRYHEDAPGATDITLNGPVVLVGPGAVGLVSAAPTSLVFDNPAATPTAVEILVGRTAA